MKTKQKTIRFMAVVLVFAGLMALPIAACAGNLEPGAPPGPTMKTLDEVEPRIPIHASDLPLTITEPNSYYLAETINFEPNNINAITIEANDVTIDLAGFSLIGQGKASGTGFGIVMYGCSNVEIRNGTVRDFGRCAIYEVSRDNGKEHRIINVRVVSNGLHGICLNGSGYLVKGCTAEENSHWGIALDYGCTVTGNTAYDNTNYGIYAHSYCLVDQNTAYNNGTNMYTGTGCVLGVNCAP